MSIKGKSSNIALPGIVCLSIEAILFGICWLLVGGMGSNLESREASLKELSQVNGCGDQFTVVPDYFDDQVVAAQKSSATGHTYALICTVLTCVSIVACCVDFASGSKSHKSHDSGSDHSDDNYRRSE